METSNSTSPGPFDTLNVEVPTTKAAPREAPATALPRYLRKDFSAQFEFLDKVLERGEISLDAATRSAAVALRTKLYRARQQHQLVFQDTEQQYKYDRVFISIEDSTVRVALLPDLSRV